MFEQLYKTVEIHGPELDSVNDGVVAGKETPGSGDGSGEDAKRLSKEWWLENFGMWVEPHFTASLDVPVYEVTERKKGCEKFYLAYGDVVGKLWVRMRAMVERFGG